MSKAAHNYAAMAVINQCNASKLRMAAGMIGDRRFQCDCVTANSEVWRQLTSEQQMALTRATQECQSAIKETERHYRAGDLARCRQAIRHFEHKATSVSKAAMA